MKNDCNELPKVLVVDDREANVLAIQRVLEGLDCHIVKAFSGEEALNQILKHDYAVILMDVQMPGMDGFEVAGLIRSHRESASTPIIFVTAINKEDRYIQEGYAVGAVDYLFKPLDPAALISKVDVFLSLYRQRFELQMAMTELNATKDALLASNQRLSDFSHTVAHDLRNPLNAITGFARVLSKNLPEDADKKVMDCVQRIRSSSERMNQMITGILQHAGQQAIEAVTFESVDLNQIVKDVESTLHFELIKTNGKIIYSDLPVIDADFTHMWQMFANLISNSLKYRRKGVDSVVNITAENKTKEGVVRLVISDNGLGFSDEDAKIIFDKFSRLNDGDAVEDSYGIGLSTVFQIVESHRGVISAVGRVDQGADFIVELPLAQEKKSAKSVLVESRRVS